MEGIENMAHDTTSEEAPKAKGLRDRETGEQAVLPPPQPPNPDPNIVREDPSDS